MAETPNPQTAVNPESKPDVAPHKAASGTKVLWTLRLEKNLKEWRERVRIVLGGLFSKDAATRRMAAFFFLSCLGFFAVAGLGGYRYYQLQKMREHELSESEKTAKHLGDFIKRQAEENKHKAGLISLGSFTIELKPLSKNKKRPYGVFDMAEIELVLDCDSRETRDYIDDHQHQVRNQVTNYFTAIDRADLMTVEGKKRIKKSLMERLNLWLPKGKVEDVYITRLLLT